MEAPTPSSAVPNDRAEDRALHARLLARDPAAPADLALAHHARLGAWLERRFPNVETVLSWLAERDGAGTPHPFDPI